MVQLLQQIIKKHYLPKRLRKTYHSFFLQRDNSSIEKKQKHSHIGTQQHLARHRHAYWRLYKRKCMQASHSNKPSTAIWNNEWAQHLGKRRASEIAFSEATDSLGCLQAKISGRTTSGISHSMLGQSKELFALWILKIVSIWGENAILPIALGRKKYLNIDSESEVERAAMFFLFFATARKWVNFLSESKNVRSYPGI